MLMHARIVIVDDRSTNLRIYAQFVSMMGAGFTSVCFQSAKEALVWLENETADLLIVDGNPLDDVAVLTDPNRRLRYVVRAGQPLAVAG